MNISTNYARKCTLLHTEKTMTQTLGPVRSALALDVNTRRCGSQYISCVLYLWAWDNTSSTSFAKNHWFVQLPFSYSIESLSFRQP